jgi:excisionase family DNA binding protein
MFVFFLKMLKIRFFNHLVSTMTSTNEDVCGTFFAAKVLGVSVSTVQGLVERSELQAWKTKGGHRRISMQSIREYQSLHGLSTMPVPSSQLHILMVEDDPQTLEAFRASFQHWNLAVDCTTMTSALEALIDISTLKPDLLLTDLMMPGVDGFELLRTLRGNADFSSMVMVAMTGLSAAEVKERGELPRNTLTVQKPVDMKWLHGFVSAMLAVRQLQAA